MIRAASITSNDFKTGMSIEIDNAPWRVVEFLHVKPGKGAAFVRTKLKNYINGKGGHRLAGPRCMGTRVHGGRCPRVQAT